MRKLALSVVVGAYVFMFVGCSGGAGGLPAGGAGPDPGPSSYVANAPNLGPEVPLPLDVDSEPGEGNQLDSATQGDGGVSDLGPVKDCEDPWKTRGERRGCWH